MQTKLTIRILIVIILFSLAARGGGIYLSAQSPEPMQTQIEKEEKFYIRTNLLSPLTNIGAAYSISDHWSVAADYYFPWIPRSKSHRNCFQILGWSLEGRYWVGKGRTYSDRMEGHSVGLSAAAGYYDFERAFKGNQGEFIKIGADYMYSLPISGDRMHIEFSVELGYIHSRVKPYEVFEEGGKAYKLGYRKNFNWFGPTKVGVSLVFPIKAGTFKANRRNGL